MGNSTPVTLGFATYTVTRHFKILHKYTKEFQKNVVIPIIHV